MKVALVCQPFNDFTIPPGGSITIWLYEVGRRLARSCDVAIYARDFRFQTDTDRIGTMRYRRLSVRYDHLLIRFLEKLVPLRPQTKPLFSWGLYYAGYALALAADLRARGDDVVHVHNFSQFVPIIRALNPRIKIVLHMHSEWLTLLDHRMIEGRLEQCDLIVGCSEQLTEKVRRAFPRFASRCQTVFNGADVDRFTPEVERVGGGRTVDRALADDDNQRIIFVGRVSPEKGLHVLLDAFREVLKTKPKAFLEIVGPEQVLPKEFNLTLNDDEKLRRLIAFYGESYKGQLEKQLPSEVAARVRFTPFLSHDQLADRYRRATLFVLPSIFEAFPLPIVEAMASGLPVVASAVGGIPEGVVDGETGLLVESDNRSALAEAILRLLNDGHLSEAMGKAGRRRAVEAFSWDRIADQWLDLYRAGPLERQPRAVARSPVY